MVTVTIDNKQVEVPEGTTVLKAAKQAGVQIPTLCDHPHLTPYGGCRLCMVEIDGFRTLQSACTIPASNNMVVHTNTPKVNQARKFVLTLIFSERNHFCPYCQVSGGDCDLQNAAYGEGMDHWDLQPNWQRYPVDASHPFFILEHNRCILCRRCIRACSELVGANTLGVEERGAKTFVIADLNVPLGDSTCVSCGTCVQVCPTGALIDRRSAYRGKETQVEHNQTVCVACSAGCGIDVLTRDGQVVRIEGDWDAAVNEGVLCKEGRYIPLTEDRQRVVTPLIRKDGALIPTTWDEALDVIAEQMQAKSIAAAASVRLPAESLYAFKKLFADTLNSDVVTTLEEGAYTALASEMAAQNGKAFEGKLDALKNASGVLVFGADLINEHQVAGFFVRRNLGKDITLVVVDAQENDLAQFTNCGLRPKPGQEITLVNGLIAAAAKLGQNKAAFAGEPDPAVAEAAAKSGVSSDLLLEAAFRMATTEKPVIVYDPAKVDSLATLQALVKLAETIGATLVDPKGGANSLAAAQYGLDKAFKLNGHKVAYIALGDEAPTETLVKNMEKAPFLVVQASHVSKLTAQADVVLPVQSWLEQAGHYISMDGRIQAAKATLPAQDGVLDNTEALARLASRLGLAVDNNWQEELLKRQSPVEIAA